jgi:hypothetical protein
VVRTLASHAGNRGSTPRGTTRIYEKGAGNEFQPFFLPKKGFPNPVLKSQIKIKHLRLRKGDDFAKVAKKVNPEDHENKNYKNTVLCPLNSLFIMDVPILPRSGNHKRRFKCIITLTAPFVS